MDQRLSRTGLDETALSLLSGELVANPFPLLAQMRSVGALVPIPLPIAGDGRQAWMVTRMEEAVRVLKDHAHFTVDPSTIGGEDLFRAKTTDTTSDQSTFFFGQNSMVAVDEPDHRRLRGLVSKAFTPRYIASLRPHIQHIADELLDQVQDQGEMDLVHDYAYPLPINVISDMLGVPPADRPQVRVWSEALATGMGSMGRPDEQTRAHMRAFAAYTRQLAAFKRQHPADDLTSQLVQNEEGDRLNEAELLSMISLLIFAGHETTSNLIGIGVLTLLDHPEQFERLKADLSLVPSAVEEFLRFNGPVFTGMPRFATEDMELGGQSIKKGDFLLIALTSANRDEAQFTQPDELDIARALNRHIAFGQGIHICLGAPLARLEGEIAFTTLLTRMPGLRLRVPRESISWRISSNLRGLTALPVAF